MEFLYFLITVFATTIGAMSGMGGGTIIKPLMDAFSGLDVAHINFMSSCAIFAMTSVRIFQGRNDGIPLDLKISIPLAVGSAMGGIIGKQLFVQITWNMELLQSSLLLFLHFAIYCYLKVKHNVKTLTVEHPLCSLSIGTGLGGISAFLGIGGGPINMMVLGYFYSSSVKVTAKRSIFIILFAQAMGLSTTLLTALPENLNYVAILFMMIGGQLGGLLGKKWSVKLSSQQVEELFQDVLVSAMVLNAFNIGRILA